MSKKIIDSHGFTGELLNDEFEVRNPFVRIPKQFPLVKRTCRVCGAPFSFRVPYDPKNPAHDLCDDCLFLPKDELALRESERSTSLQILNSEFCAEASEHEFGDG